MHTLAAGNNFTRLGHSFLHSQRKVSIDNVGNKASLGTWYKTVPASNACLPPVPILRQNNQNITGIEAQL